jgi:hypothetical protein
MRALTYGLVAAVLLAGCSQAGSATTRIDQAEDEIELVSARIVEEVGLEVTVDRPLRSRSRCQLAGGRDGASNALSLRGPIPALDDPIGRAAATLIESGYELIDSDIGEGVFGRRDGIRITVIVDLPTQQLAIDANTGCRPQP